MVTEATGEPGRCSRPGGAIRRPGGVEFPTFALLGDTTASPLRYLHPLAAERRQADYATCRPQCASVTVTTSIDTIRGALASAIAR